MVKLLIIMTKLNGLNKEQQALFDKLKSKLQQNVALKSLEGHADIDAYRLGGGKAKKMATQSQCAKEILDIPEVVAFINSVRNNIIKSSIMTRKEALERLTTFARGDMSKLVKFRTVETEDAEGDIVKQAVWDILDSEKQSKDQLSTISEVTASKDGIKIKQHDPKAAIKQLADMEGWNSAQEFTITDNISIDKLQEAIKKLEEKGISIDALK